MTITPLRAFALAVALLAAGLAMILAPGLAQSPPDIRVTDGDTIRIDRQRVRLIGFDTPEIRRAKCPYEREKGLAAKARLQQLVDAGGISVNFVPCACPAGTEGTRRCNFGRKCAVMTANGKDVADILIAEGLARRLTCTATSCPKLEGWCGG